MGGLGELIDNVGDWFSTAGDTASSAVSDGWSTSAGTGFDSAAWGMGAATDGAGSLASDVASGATDWASGIGDSWLTDAAGNYTADGVAGADAVGGITADVGGGAGISVGGAGIDYGGMDTGVGSGFNSATWGGDNSGATLFDQLKAKAGKIDLAGAGMKLGAQALGSMAKAPGSDQMSSYLNDVKGREAQAQMFNMDMATKRAGVGDSLATSGNAMDPNYYATQQQNATKNRDAAGWAENEANMRTRGFDENAIAAERNRAGLTSSTNQGTSYDAGYQTGTNAKNATLGAAGANYTQVSQPTAGLSGAYSQLGASDSQAQKGWGNAIEQAFGVVNSTTKKATE